ncbi:MAG: lipase family protein [Caulobacteraceae bacterium]|nr:lipase family protein [Caulobacteraceae bacterium]
MAAGKPPAPPRLTAGDAVAIPTWRAAYSDRTAALMAIFSELAYIPFVDAQPPPGPGAAKAEKPGGRDALAACLAGGKFALAGVFNRNDVQAFLAVNPAEFAVLAFRGTANLADWAIDLDALRMDLPGFPGVRVHSGFWKAFAVSADEIRSAVDAAVPADLGLYITGHSLGGALAQIASAALERDNLAACYTFGSPRVATRDFDRQVKCPHYRLVNHWDLVPGVPLASPWGYQHSGDPRLLAARTPKAPLRRDRNLLAWLAVELWSLAVWLPSRRFFAVEDHMIWNYRTQLEVIAGLRTRGRGLTAAWDQHS